MDVLLVALGSSGDVHPLVGLAAELQARGRKVALITNGQFEPLVRQAGIEFVPIGTVEEFRSVMENPDLWHPRKAFPLIAEYLLMRQMRPLYELIVALSTPGKSVVVAPSTAYGARLAQEKHGIALATIQLQPSMLRSEYESPVLPPLQLGPGVPRWFKRFQFWLSNRFLIEPLIGRRLNEFRQELGLAPERNVFFFGDWWHSPQKVLGLFPDWFAPPQPDWPANTVLTGFPLWDERGLAEAPPELAAYLDAGTPPIVFTPGSAMLHGHEFFLAAAEACRQLDRRGILLTRYAEQIPADLPDGVRHFDFVPFSLLLPRAAALVHHGGIGTASQALAAGVPQLVMPMAHDQPDNAWRLRRLGVGSSLLPRQFNTANVARELNMLLTSPQVAESCRAVAERFSGRGGIDRACDEIESLL